MMNRKNIAIAAVMAAAAIAFGGCGATEENNTTVGKTQEMAAAEETADAAGTEAAVEEATDEAADGATEESTEPGVLKPLPSGYDLDNLMDCQPNVQFTSDDFNWRGGNLTFEVYATLLYDMVDVHNLKVGDSIEVGDRTIEVKTIDDTDYGRVVNEGEGDEITLAPGEGGTYEIRGYDDYSEMEDLGQAEAMLSDHIKLIDCTDNPGETVEVGPDEIKQYTEELSESRQTFNPNATTILIENGEITEIKRVWVP